jgi:hypothetical protein
LSAIANLAATRREQGDLAEAQRLHEQVLKDVGIGKDVGVGSAQTTQTPKRHCQPGARVAEDRGALEASATGRDRNLEHAHG